MTDEKRSWSVWCPELGISRGDFLDVTAVSPERAVVRLVPQFGHSKPDRLEFCVHVCLAHDCRDFYRFPVRRGDDGSYYVQETEPRLAQGLTDATPRPWRSSELYQLYSRGFQDARAHAVAAYAVEIGYEPTVLRTGT